MIEVKNLTKKFNKKTVAVKEVNFSLYQGEICVLLGPNGAGKSTTIKCIAGLLRYKGDIVIDGMNNHSIEAKKTVAYVPETPAIYDLLTVKEHIVFIEKVYNLDHDEEGINKLLIRFDMMDKVDKLGSELSKGMKQKLSILLGVIINPMLILFDEPMIGLDPKAIKELKLLLEELVEKGTIILLSTHIIDSIMENYDRVLIMNEGEFVANMTRDDVNKTGKNLETLFFELTDLKLDEVDNERLEVKEVG